jgi:ABC-2 type transport system ATP-binding protein
MTSVIEASGVSKSYGSFEALKGVSFSIPMGRIVGVIGANGAGKSTLLNAILGLSKYDGELSVLGLDPNTDRDELMEDVCFISDVATLPRWMKVSDVLNFVEGVHSKFSRDKAMDYLARTKIPLDKKVKALSKGMVTQLHLAVVMSIDAKLLVLDEPTLGLDIIFRKNFYEALLTDFFDHERTILITTHQVEEIESILTDAMFIRDGEMVMYRSMEELAETVHMVVVDDEHKEAAAALGPIYTKSVMGMHTYMYDGVDRSELKKLGEPKHVGLADLFVAKMTGGDQ